MSNALTIDQLQNRLKTTQSPADPLAVEFEHLGSPLPEAVVSSIRDDLQPAAVLIPIIQRQNGLMVLLTERSSALKYHAGQVSFPGGRMEPDDECITTTALRETYEEVGIAPSQVEVFGYLPPCATVTGYAVTAVIGLIMPGHAIALDSAEVAEAFEVPMEFLLAEGNVTYDEYDYKGGRVPVATYDFEGHKIWGVTAGIILNLREILIRNNSEL
tara:strand:+ start:615 stop:1259 length:645 start_codon:yes stop_codon:yes gene_type:complete